MQFTNFISFFKCSYNYEIKDNFQFTHFMMGELKVVRVMNTVVFDKPQTMQQNSIIVRIKFLVLLCIFCPCAGYIKILKAECTSLDLSFSYFKSCEMKSQENKDTIINFYVGMHYKKPIDDVTVSTLPWYTVTHRSKWTINKNIFFCKLGNCWSL